MISAIVLAAGKSVRMGEAKMVLPWKNTTVIGQVVESLVRAGVSDIVVVTGGAREAVEGALCDVPARLIYNPDYAHGDMLSSFQTGLRALGENAEAALVVLGDQPQIEPWVVKSVIQAYQDRHSMLVVPSFQMRRGHPWLIGRSLWDQALALKQPATLRDFLGALSDQIEYVSVGTKTILEDVDTPEDYQRFKVENDVC